MQVDGLAIALRPRPMAEAADLGVQLVRNHARSVWRTFLPVYVVTVLLALCTFEIAGWLPSLLIFWLKPWFDRSLLFVHSRAVFGQETRWSDLWQNRRAVWGGQLLRTDESVATSLLSAAVYAGVVLVLEPFYVASGFAMYLNRRVELEAWDIEQEFRLAFAR